MSATDELRRLLDDRGVEWIHGRLRSDSTAWLDGDMAVVAGEYGDGLLLVERKMTPAQAIDATLGRGTCHIDVIDSGEIACYCCNERIMHCNGCGHEFGYVLYDEDGNTWMSEQPNYCPNCGREVRA